ncbi:DUF6165 family protein [Rhodoplanes sp. TEM]|uniref:DUF6165 family protein n=1 Tax=Rhodoplanes tepidamans TaxID=200616 RepID=A0ABT5JII8_RHOTP|nr:MULTISPECIES: DUF6165 family protein [Rhodoplanes]MDC7789171.1 DUF6165 family protein [Rhodoplanes tepidamans]MDC7987177.1 DUF6165 family protein [Rhodoplanes sp. TEM]MDQ0358541.1 hypothetical protein [Rhodoplanes tepidamans]
MTGASNPVAPASRIVIAVSAGELVDKVTILEIKSERIGDPAKLANIRHELSVLTASLAPLLAAHPGVAPLKAALRSVNESLWQIEDDIRDCERHGDFGEAFVALARAVYRTNDRRAGLKREIDTLVGSELTEEKSYAAY